MMGPGSVIGEVGVLTGSKRTATVRTETPVNALWIMADDLHNIIRDSPTLKLRLLHTAGARIGENNLFGKEPYNSLGQLRLRRWLLAGTVETPEGGKVCRLKSPAVLLTGEAVLADGDQLVTAPAVIEPAAVTFREGAQVFMCPAMKFNHS